MFTPYGNALNQEALARAHLAQSSGGCDPNGIGGYYGGKLILIGFFSKVCFVFLPTAAKSPNP